MTASWRLKFDRALQHLDDLTGMFKEFVEGQHEAIGIASNPEAGVYRIDLGDIEGPPIGMSLVIGDCVQNLRASLDHIIWHITPDQEKAEHPKRPEFPICANADDYMNRGARAVETLPSALKALVESKQPYNTHANPTESPLLWLNELSNIDKHRRIHVVGTWASFKGVHISQAGHADVIFGDPGPPAEVIGKVMKKVGDDRPEIPEANQVIARVGAVVTIVFKDAGGLSDRRVISTLRTIRDEVNEVLMMVESAI
jgi:hypothetical protein